MSSSRWLARSLPGHHPSPGWPTRSSPPVERRDPKVTPTTRFLRETGSARVPVHRGGHDLDPPLSRPSIDIPSNVHSRDRSPFGSPVPPDARVPSSRFLTASTACSVRRLQVCCTLLPIMGFTVFHAPFACGSGDPQCADGAPHDAGPFEEYPSPIAVPRHRGRLPSCRYRSHRTNPSRTERPAGPRPSRHTEVRRSARVPSRRPETHLLGHPEVTGPRPKTQQARSGNRTGVRRERRGRRSDSLFARSLSERPDPKVGAFVEQSGSMPENPRIHGRLDGLPQGGFHLVTGCDPQAATDTISDPRCSSALPKLRTLALTRPRPFPHAVMLWSEDLHVTSPSRPKPFRTAPRAPWSARESPCHLGRAAEATPPL